MRLRVSNRLKQDSSIHWHGLLVPFAMDGVPEHSQNVVPPGGTFDYSFRLPDAGLYWYHPHVMSAAQVGFGLYGLLRTPGLLKIPPAPLRKLAHRPPPAARVGPASPRERPRRFRAPQPERSETGREGTGRSGCRRPPVPGCPMPRRSRDRRRRTYRGSARRRAPASRRPRRASRATRPTRGESQSVAETPPHIRSVTSEGRGSPIHTARSAAAFVFIACALVLALLALARRRAGRLDRERRVSFDNARLFWHYTVGQSLVGIALVHGFPGLVG